MIRTETFRKQHAEIKTTIDRITELFDVSALKDDAGEVRDLISRLVDKLTIHLLMEDKVLYPRLATSLDAGLKNLAQSFQAETGGLRNTLNIYQKAWSTAEAVQAAPDKFIMESTSFFESLQQRILLEDEKLFSIIENQQPRQSKYS